jgi:hypothetical protein
MRQYNSDKNSNSQGLTLPGSRIDEDDDGDNNNHNDYNEEDDDDDDAEINDDKM